MPIDTNNSSSLSTAAPADPAIDYSFLRRQAIERLQQLSGCTWSDFNAHDPGVTILEQLCYALSDLSYRIGHPLPDLLYQQPGQPDAAGQGQGADSYGSYNPAQMLPSAPVTLVDLR